MSFEGFAIRATDAIITTTHRVDKIPVLPPYRIAFRSANRAARTDVNHNVMVCQFDRKAVREEVETDMMPPSQETG